jgi:chemotaxis protein methyltransferase CheR
MERLLLDLSINVTSMFRDPTFYAMFREKVVPTLRTYPFTRIWCAGCSTGEEVFSLAILLREEGLYERTRIYATDINEHVLAKAREGVFPLDKMRLYTQNYIRGGGTREFSEYYVAAYDSVRFSRTLVENVVFAQHNLAMDTSFNEFNVILCRNVMIYFDKPLQEHVHELFYKSLERFGVIALGHTATGFTRYATATRRSTGRADLPQGRGRVRAHRDRNVLWWTCRSEPVAGRPSRRRAPADRGRTAPAGRDPTKAAASPARIPHAPGRLRSRRQDDARAGPRLPGATGLPPARRRRVLRAVDGRARPVREAVDDCCSSRSPTPTPNGWWGSS